MECMRETIGRTKDTHTLSVLMHLDAKEHMPLGLQYTIAIEKPKTISSLQFNSFRPGVPFVGHRQTE